MYNWLAVVDLGSWIPLFFDLVFGASTTTIHNKYMFRLFLMVRTTRILQVYRLLRLARSAKTRQGVLIGLTAICIIICAAATVQTLEYCDPTKPHQTDGLNCQNLSFFDSIYFVCITIGTVGYVGAR
ncbi:hypothetical protein PINS_up009458 [Pythium insidiosum]|nr:hypothetical protein PINS_up009458 [Pythium insidiosum]